MTGVRFDSAMDQATTILRYGLPVLGCSMAADSGLRHCDLNDL